jgi:predicted metal-binding protein
MYKHTFMFMFMLFVCIECEVNFHNRSTHTNNIKKLLEVTFKICVSSKSKSQKFELQTV